MSEFSQRMAATALRLLNAKGQAMILERNPTGTMNAAGVRTPSPADSPVQGVFLPTLGTINVDGVDVAGAKVLLAAVTPPPATGNHITIENGPNAGHYRVARAKNWAPDGELIYSDLEVAL